MLRAPIINGKNWKNDILAGVVVALVSIPISMGYAQIAGLPVVYGLYGSVLPILLYGLLTTSPQFVIGVDAMPAVMAGSAIAGMGFALGSPEAVALNPVLSLFAAWWFLVFFALRAGRVVKYISTPVMGGFISGIGATIILMQVPKLFGGAPGTGELIALMGHIAGELQSFHLLSAVLGFGTVTVLLIAKKLLPRFPMTVVMLLFGVLLTAVFHVDAHGVKLLPAVEPGLPALSFPDLSLLAGHVREILTQSLLIALVVMAQTLLATNNYASKYGYTVDNRRELLAYAAAELGGALVGCCPVNGSVSRSGIADQFGCKSQVMSLTAAGVMVLVLLFGTSLLSLLPVPVLTGIVVFALIGILEIPLAKRLWRADRREFLIFLTAFFGVLLFGTIYGVVIGVILSFFAVVVRAVVPPRAFLGMIPGQEGLYNLSRNRDAKPVEGTVIYRFSGNLFFANVGTFQEDILSALRPDTRRVIVDGQGIANIDVTAAERVTALERRLREKGVRLYLTGHVGAVNDQLRRYGAEELIHSGAVRRTVELALRDAGMEPPYPLVGAERTGTDAMRSFDGSFAEFEWLFGDHAEEQMESLAREIAADIAGTAGVTLSEAERHAGWWRFGDFDEDELLDFVELQLERMAEAGDMPEEELRSLETRLEQSRAATEKKLQSRSPVVMELLTAHREKLRAHLRERHPREAERIAELRRALKERQK